MIESLPIFIDKVFLKSHFLDQEMPVVSPALLGFQKAANVVKGDLSQISVADIKDDYPKDQEELGKRISYLRESPGNDLVNNLLKLAKYYSEYGPDELLRYCLAIYCFTIGKNLVFSDQYKESRTYLQIFIYLYNFLSEENHRDLNRDFYEGLSCYFQSYNLSIDLYIDSDPSDEFYYRFIDVVNDIKSNISLGRIIIEISVANLNFIINILGRLRSHSQGKFLLEKISNSLLEVPVFNLDPLRSMRILESIDISAISTILSKPVWKNDREKTLLAVSLIKLAFLLGADFSIFSGKFVNATNEYKSDLAYSIFTCSYEDSLDKQQEISSKKVRLVAEIVGIEYGAKNSEYLVGKIKDIQKLYVSFLNCENSESKTIIYYDLLALIEMSKEWSEKTQYKFSPTVEILFDKITNNLAFEHAKIKRDTELMIKLVTNKVCLSSIIGARLVFEITNAGEGIADNIYLTARPVAGEYEIDEKYQEIRINILEERQYVQIETMIRPVGGNRYINISVELKYNSLLIKNKTVRLDEKSSIVWLYPENYFNRLAQRYNISTPATNLFYGRQSLLDLMADCLHQGAEHDTSMIVYGIKRAGKTSIVKRFVQQTIPEKGLTQSYIAIYADVSLHKPHITDDESFLSYLIEIINRGLPDEIKKRLSIGVSFINEIRQDPYETFKYLLEEILSSVFPKKIILVLDEFSGLSDMFDSLDQSQGISYALSAFLANIVQSTNQLTVIFTGTYMLFEMIEKRQDLFKICKPFMVTFLEQMPARQLIKEPLLDSVIDHESQVELDERVVDKITTITNGHPFLIQYICMHLIDRINNYKSLNITLFDVNEVIKEVVTKSHHKHIFTVMWDEFADLPHQKILFVIASLSTERNPSVNLEKIVQILGSGGQKFDDETILYYCGVLKDAGLIKQVGSVNLSYQVAIPLYQMWLKHNRSTRMIL